MRVGTFNLWSGRGRDGLVDAGRLAESVRSLADAGVDVLVVQEVDRGQPRSGGADQLGAVAEAFGAVDARFCPTVFGEPGSAAGWVPATAGLDQQVDEQHPSTPPAPSYGIGVVSRLPVLAWRLRRLRGSRAVLPVAVPRDGRGMRVLWVSDEPRAALAAVVAGDSGPVTVIGVHLSFAPPAAVRQLRTVRRWADSLPGPRVLAGDLNLPGGVPARVTGWRSLARASTFPAADPRVQLDHVLTDAASDPVEHKDSRTGEALLLPLSDHRALVADDVRL
ncbi:endonuclease/exonuclease/phosphatase family protein [Angustibacter luteus]|uniref:Endonuclease/exonuclease/phosphatase family protein n=1 Tax=Angustibacter luteus TaxID=658456 RepID=A0ABW1JG12_9ACTN